MAATIGGETKRFRPLIEIYREYGRRAGHASDKDQAFHNVETGLRLAIAELYALRGRS